MTLSSSSPTPRDIRRAFELVRNIACGETQDLQELSRHDLRSEISFCPALAAPAAEKLIDYLKHNTFLFDAQNHGASELEANTHRALITLVTDVVIKTKMDGSAFVELAAQICFRNSPDDGKDKQLRLEAASRFVDLLKQATLPPAPAA